MFLAGLSNQLKPGIPGWKDHKSRPLHEAAHLARLLAEAEDLPITKTLAQNGSSADLDGWYAESILKAIPFQGGGKTVGREPQVQREDFVRYIEWLRSVW